MKIPKFLAILIFSFLISLNTIYFISKIISVNYQKNIDDIYSINVILNKYSKEDKFIVEIYKVKNKYYVNNNYMDKQFEVKNMVYVFILLMGIFFYIVIYL